jgi:hypothetical protein
LIKSSLPEIFGLMIKQIKKPLVWPQKTKHIKLATKKKHESFFVQIDQNPENSRTRRTCPVNMNQNPDQIRTKQRHRHARNQLLNNNQASNINDYQPIIMIWSK